MSHMNSATDLGMAGGPSPSARHLAFPGENALGWRGVLFGIDPRSLALFRILIALILLLDLAVRATDLAAMYTDDGMFSRAEICYRVTSIWNWSFHFGSGAWQYQAFLFSLAGGLAVCLLVGFETRIAAIGSWLLLVSLQHRVLAVLSGAEILLRMLLFWAMFLPLDRCWSFDGWRRRRRGEMGSDRSMRVVSIGSAAILLQMAQMYFFSAIFKSNEQWFHGEALAGSLAHSFYALPPAAFLLKFPTALKLLTWASLALEWVGPVLLFSPRYTAPIRLVIIASLAAMHVVICISMAVGLFSYVAIAGLTLFIPPEFWSNAFFRRIFPFVSFGDDEGANPPPRSRRQTQFATVAHGFCTVALAWVIAININSIPSHPLAALSPEGFKPVGIGLGLAQSWGMFGEVPSKNGWYIGRAILRNGSEVDLLRNGAPVDWRRPDYPAQLYPNHLWQKLFREMCYFDEQGFQVYRAPVADYLCRNWNSGHKDGERVAAFEFQFCEMNPAGMTNLSPPLIVRNSLVRLDYPIDGSTPIASGYGDADPALAGGR